MEKCGSNASAAFCGIHLLNPSSKWKKPLAAILKVSLTAPKKPRLFPESHRTAGAHLRAAPRAGRAISERSRTQEKTG